ncbi:hypothetical protein CI1B_33800 [Bradyrhizobium ivorense]|uniref:Uncharacterized protein n=1 Tax=Bradyrhizobium ivorense TaxID=2511166 RepID=A0A508T751_9BRAD|nr:hypothetical protein CI1B_33800 [Bradyrhizobium ivorense]
MTSWKPPNLGASLRCTTPVSGWVVVGEGWAGQAAFQVAHSIAFNLGTALPASSDAGAAVVAVDELIVIAHQRVGRISREA